MNSRNSVYNAPAKKASNKIDWSWLKLTESGWKWQRRWGVKTPNKNLACRNTCIVALFLHSVLECSCFPAHAHGISAPAPWLQGSAQSRWSPFHHLLSKSGPPLTTPPLSQWQQRGRQVSMQALRAREYQGFPNIQAREKSTNPNFRVRIFSGGVGVFHVKGWGPKSSICPSKPGKSNFFGGISQDFAGISPKCPKSLRKRSLCSIFGR